MGDTQSGRLLSLDIFRGLTIAFMLLVNNPGSWKHIFAPLRHAHWHGCTPTDLVFPFFLFIVGVAVVFSVRARLARGNHRSLILRHTLVRTAILFLLGLFLNAFPSFELSTLRIPGVLQRIALVYLACSLLELYLGVRLQVLALTLILFVYWGLMTLVNVPGIGPANLEKGTNLAAWADRLLLEGHLWRFSKTWDPEGVLSTLPAIGSGILGMLAGHVLRSRTSGASFWRSATVVLAGAGGVCILAGLAWNMVFPLNKSLWSSSYALFTGGLALVTLAVLHFLCDVRGFVRPFFPLQVFGMNAILAFVLSALAARLLHVIKVAGPGPGGLVSLKQFLYSALFAGLPPKWASLAWAASTVLLWFVVLWALYRRRVFVKI